MMNRAKCEQCGYIIVWDDRELGFHNGQWLCSSCAEKRITKEELGDWSTNCSDPFNPLNWKHRDNEYDGGLRLYIASLIQFLLHPSHIVGPPNGQGDTRMVGAYAKKGMDALKTIGYTRTLDGDPIEIDLTLADDLEKSRELVVANSVQGTSIHAGPWMFDMDGAGLRVGDVVEYPEGCPYRITAINVHENDLLLMVPLDAAAYRVPDCEAKVRPEFVRLDPEHITSLMTEVPEAIEEAVPEAIEEAEPEIEQKPRLSLRRLLGA